LGISSIVANLPPAKKLRDRKNIAYGSGHFTPKPKIATPAMTASMVPTMPVTMSRIERGASLHSR
jgi:hypothetical protein